MSAPARYARALAPAIFGVLVLAAWQAAVVWREIPPYILPTPLAVARTLWQDGAGLLGALFVTLRVTLAAFAAATVLGLALALTLAQSRLLERTLQPYLVILQVTPIVSIAPLVIIWANNVFAALLVCAWVVAFFPVVANTTVGLNSIDRGLGELFRLYRASRWQTFRHLRMPSALPYFLSGVRISGGLALIGAVVAEFVAGTGGSETGLAYRILEAGYRLQTARLFAALFLLSAAGIAIHAILGWISRRILRRWHESGHPPA